MNAPLLVTTDPALLDDLLRLAAAAGVVLDVAQEPREALHLWSAAPLVLVGSDLARAVAEHSPPRRGDVLLLAGSEPDYRLAVALGARDVVSLPEGEDWVVDALADVGDGGARAALTVGVVGGSGGVGATTVACAVAALAARTGPALAVDLDPGGPGIELVLGVEPHGLCWGELAGSRGRLGSRALREALPRSGDLSVLGWGHGDPVLDDAAVREVLAAAQRGHDVVCVDLARGLDPLSAEVAARCDHLVLVAACSLPGAAAAMRTLSVVRSVTSSIHLVARTSGSAVAPEALESALGLPLVAALGHQRGLPEHLDLGLGPLHARRGPVAQAAQRILERLSS